MRGRKCNIQKGLESRYSLGSRPCNLDKDIIILHDDTHTHTRAHTGDYLARCWPVGLFCGRCPHVPRLALLSHNRVEVAAQAPPLVRARAVRRPWRFYYAIPQFPGSHSIMPEAGSIMPEVLLCMLLHAARPTKCTYTGMAAPHALDRLRPASRRLRACIIHSS